MRLAAIDIGTLTCRLLIADVSASGELVELRSERKVLRLGEGLAQTMKLSGPAMTRVIETLKEWRRLMEQERVEGQAVIATLAVREATNAKEFLQRVKDEVGWSVRVLTGQEEAQLTFLGIRHGMSQLDDKILGLDIGGGSTEFMFAARKDAIVLESIPLGVVTLTEQMLGSNALDADQVTRARERVREKVDPVRAKLGDVSGSQLVGTAGAITTIAAMVQKLPAYDRARVHNFRLTIDAVRDLEKELLERTAAQRRGLPGLEPGREDVIAASLLILRTVMEEFGFETCVVSDFGLREGVVLDLAKRLSKQ